MAKVPDYERYRREYEQEQSRPDEQQSRVQYERFLRVADNVLLAENLRRMKKPKKIKQYESIIAAERGILLAP